MRKTLTLLVASTALSAGLGLPAWSAPRAPATEDSRPFAALFASDQDTTALFLVSGDDDDDRGSRNASRSDDDEDDDEEDDDCEDGGCNSAGNPAPAGSVAPPQNGLFGTGAPPKVQVN